MRLVELKKGVEDILLIVMMFYDVFLVVDDRNNKECMLWDEEQVVILKDVFCIEIENKLIIMVEVREKI